MDFKKRFALVPIDKVIEPPTKEGPYWVMKDRYWNVKDGCILFFIYYGGYSAQCNRNKSIADRLSKEGCEVRFLERVFLPCREVDHGVEFYPKDLIVPPKEEE